MPVLLALDLCMRLQAPYELAAYTAGPSTPGSLAQVTSGVVAADDYSESATDVSLEEGLASLEGTYPTANALGNKAPSADGTPSNSAPSLAPLMTSDNESMTPPRSPCKAPHVPASPMLLIPAGFRQQPTPNTLAGACASQPGVPSHRFSMSGLGLIKGKALVQPAGSFPAAEVERQAETFEQRVRRSWLRVFNGVCEHLGGSDSEPALLPSQWLPNPSTDGCTPAMSACSHAHLHTSSNASPAGTADGYVETPTLSLGTKLGNHHSKKPAHAQHTGAKTSTAAYGGVMSTECQRGSTVVVFRGLRVRMGMHSGVEDASQVSVNAASRRTQYSGLPMYAAKTVGDAGERLKWSTYL